MERTVTYYRPEDNPDTATAQEAHDLLDTFERLGDNLAIRLADLSTEANQTTSRLRATLRRLKNDGLLTTTSSRGAQGTRLTVYCIDWTATAQWEALYHREVNYR